MIHAATSISPWRDLANVFSLPKNVPVRNNIIFFSRLGEVGIQSRRAAHITLKRRPSDCSLHLSSSKVGWDRRGRFHQRKEEGKGLLPRIKGSPTRRKKRSSIYLFLLGLAAAAGALIACDNGFAKFFLLIRLTKIMSDV